MRILLLAHTFNSLAQRVHAELVAAGHDVSIEFDIADSVTEEAVATWRPDLVIAPFLKRRIPESVYSCVPCIVMHPGIVGDRGPSAIDWAIARGETRWGVTALLANGEMDAGDVYASVEFPLRVASKGSLYRNEVTEAAVEALHETLAKIARGEAPRAVDIADPAVHGRVRPLMKQADRRLHWDADDTATLLAKLRAADGVPGVADTMLGVPVHLYDAHPEGGAALTAKPGTVVGRRGDAVLVATRDGALWITHVKRDDDAERPFKLPATVALADRLDGVPELPLAADARVAHPTWRPIVYEEDGAVGCLHFPFYNGAMGTAHCEALRRAVVAAKARPTRVLVLFGGPDFWSNGIHLNLIEASAHPAEESWRNINAMNDVVREIVLADRQITIAAMQGNAGAGGAFLALAADRVWARDGVILNPHYKGMGNLYGSEYWTYLAPRRIGAEASRALTQARLPLTAHAAVKLGFIDECFGASPAAFRSEVMERARMLAADTGYAAMLDAKAARRRADEAAKPLEAYRAEELAKMQQNFFGFDPSYHVARAHFVCKIPRSRTPLYLARHRARKAGSDT